MSTLQIGLLVIAVIAVAGVYLYNLIEERRIKRRMEGAFRKPDDVLLRPSAPAPERARQEPTLAADEDAVVVRISAQASEQVAQQEASEPAPQTPVEREPPRRTTAAERAPDGMIECLANFEFESPVPASELVAHTAGAPMPGLTWYGRAPGSEHWRVLGAAEADGVRDAVAGLQLANRQGPVSKARIVEFLETMNAIARQHGAALMSPEAADEALRADALDKACAAVDVQVGLSLLRREGSPLAGTKLRGVAEGAGFRLNGQGRFEYLHEETGRLMFELADVGGRELAAETLKSMQFAGVTLILDLPRVQEPLKAFDQMRTMAKRMGSMLEATLVDDARRPLSDSALATIRDQLQQTCATLRDMNVEPGGERALRLFC